MIVDDDPLARDRVKWFMRSQQEIVVAGECSDGLEALRLIRSLRPDIVLLDVHMPLCDGLQVLAKLSSAERPSIVLSSAQQRFAIDGFKECVIDFLLKPFDRERFDLALDRAAQNVVMRRARDLVAKVEHIVSAPSLHQKGRLVVRIDGRVVVLRSEEIYWVEAANNYSLIHLAGTERLLVRETLSSLEKRLGTEDFTRINRSAIVQVDQIRELQPSKYGDYLVVLVDGTRLPLKRGIRRRLAEFVSGEF